MYSEDLKRFKFIRNKNELIMLQKNFKNHQKNSVYAAASDSIFRQATKFGVLIKMCTNALFHQVLVLYLN